MEYDEKKFTEIRKKFKKIPQKTWIYFMYNDQFKGVWFINYNKEDKYVLVKWPFNRGFLKKLYITEDKMYLKNEDYKKIFPKKSKKKSTVKKSKKKSTVKKSKKNSNVRVIRIRV